MAEPYQQPGESPLETLLLDTAGRPRRTRRWLPRVLLLLLLLLLVLGGYWSREPKAPAVPADTGSVTGVASTAMLAATVRTLLDKPGGLVANDMLPPGVLMDDMPAFENGVLEEARTFLRALRRDFSRPENQSVEDPDLLRAEPRLLFGSGNWQVPSAEDEYADAIVAIDSYVARLQADPPSAQFHPRADGLARWLDEVGAQLDEHTRLLAAAPDTPWLEIDNRFFAARGYCWALRAQLAALRRDFSVAGSPRADARFAVALAALDGALRPVTSPVVLNGGEYGVLANHSLVLAGHVGRVAVALRDLRTGLASR